MTCKDCIHDKVCDWWAVDTGLPFVNPNICQHFKNKADYVEVVRCYQCRYNKPTSDRQVYACLRRSMYTDKQGFCHCGERKDK